MDYFRPYASPKLPPTSCLPEPSVPLNSSLAPPDARWLDLVLQSSCGLICSLAPALLASIRQRWQPPWHALPWKAAQLADSLAPSLSPTRSPQTRFGLQSLVVPRNPVPRTRWTPQASVRYRHRSIHNSVALRS